MLWDIDSPAPTVHPGNGGLPWGQGERPAWWVSSSQGGSGSMTLVKVGQSRDTQRCPLWLLEMPSWLRYRDTARQCSQARVQPGCLAPHTGWAWSMMGRATAAVTRYGWAASWHPWYRLPSIDSTGPAAASRSSAATCSEYLPGSPRVAPLWVQF